MRDVFTTAWQVANDVALLKELAKENIQQITDLQLDGEGITLPVAIDYTKGVQNLDIHFEFNTTTDTFLEIGSEGEYTIFYENKAIGSIDYNHSKIWLGRFDNTQYNLTCTVDRHWQEYVKSERMFDKAYSFPTLHSVTIFDLNRPNYKTALLLEQILEFFENQNNKEMIDKLFYKLNVVNFQNTNKNAIFKQVESICLPFIANIESLFSAEVLFIGNSHLDLLFKWSDQQTIVKNERTNANFYSNYLFDSTKKTLFSQTILLKYIVDYYPYQLSEFNEMITSGALQIVSDGLTEYDTNIPSPLNIYNNIIEGQKITKKLFDCNSCIAFLPDTFGYSATLPKIYNNLGITHFITTKLLWNDTNKFPFTNFIWNSGGGEVNSYKTERGYGGKINLHEIYALKKNSTTTNLIYLYGEGDGGGGPSIDDYLTIDVIEKYFKNINISNQNLTSYLNQDTNLPIVKGELYLEKHRGVYTTSNWIKKLSRQTETLLHNIEIRNNNNNIDTTELKYFLSYLSFHDTISGTMIDSAFEHVKNYATNINEKYQHQSDVLAEIPVSTVNATNIFNPQINCYNDRAGYFDSWDISYNIFNNKLETNSCCQYKLDSFVNQYNDIEITVNITDCQYQKLIKLQPFKNFDAEYIYCDNGLGTTIRSIDGNVKTSQFEFPHQNFVAFKHDGKYLGIINTGKYGSSFNENYELSLLKTGVFPSKHSEQFATNEKIYITVANNIKEIREKSNFYNNKTQVSLDFYNSTDISVESIITYNSTKYAIVINNNLEISQSFTYNATDYTIAPNSHILVAI